MKTHNISQEFIHLTQKPIGLLLASASIPSIIIMLVSTIYSATDTYFISRLGQTHLTASVGVVYSYITILQAAGYFFGHGSGNYMSRCLGKNDYAEVQKTGSIGFIVSLFAGILISVVSFMFIDHLVNVLGAGISKNLRNGTKTYLLYIIPSAPFMISSLTLNNQLRLQGMAGKSLLGMGTGMILNIVLDPLFIFTFNMEIKGAGLATLCGQAISFFILFVLSLKNKTLQPGCIKPNKKIIKEIAGGGTPNLLRQGITAVSSVLLIHRAGMYGEYVIASFTITGKICMSIFAVVIGIGHGFQPICGCNYGAGLFHRVKKSFTISLVSISVFLTCAIIFLLPFSSMVMNLFTNNFEIITTGKIILRIQCITVLFLGYYTMAGMFLQNTGKFVSAAVVTSSRQIFYIPLLLLLPGILGLQGIILAQALADLAAFVLCIPLCQKNLNMLKIPH